MFIKELLQSINVRKDKYTNREIYNREIDKINKIDKYTMSAGGYSTQYGRCTCGHGYGCTCRRNDDGYNFMNSDYNRQLPNNTLTISTGLTFDQLPSVTFKRGPIERKFPPVRRFLSPSNFETIRSWIEIDHAITTYFMENGIAYRLLEDYAIFYVKGVPNDKNLNFDIYCCHTESNTFIIEFRRAGTGNIEILNRIFVGIMNLLVENEEELDE
jgi:hypothetical protein